MENSNMKKCPECGLENRDIDVYCDCGHSFLDEFPLDVKQSILLEQLVESTEDIRSMMKFFYVISIISLIIGGISFIFSIS